MADDFGDGGEESTGLAAEENVPTWTGLTVSHAAEEDGDLAASQWIDAAEDATDPTMSQQAPPENTPIRARWKPLVLLGVVLALVATGFAGWALGRASLSSSETVGDADLSATAESNESDDRLRSEDAAVDGADVVAGLDDADGTTITVEGAGSTGIGDEDGGSEAFVVPETPDNPSGATQYAVMADGKAVMRGWYPTEEQALAAVADAAVIMGGMENVVNETEVEPGAEIRPDSFAVYLQDFILFETNSAEITPEFYDFLGFPLFFMQNNSAATVTVVARTDARGTESYNLALATRRAEAVRDYWVANGANIDQIILDPRGEEEAADDADDEQAALDRRVELQVSGFLAG